MKNYTLKQIRSMNFKTQKEVADHLGITVTYLSLIECGKKRPSDVLKKKLAKEYHMDTVDIYKAIEKKERLMKMGVKNEG